MTEQAMKLALDALHEIEALPGISSANLYARRALKAIAALAEQSEQDGGDTVVQTFTGLPKRKLHDLLAVGWEVNGVCFQRIETGGTVRRGAVTTSGMELWWNQEQPAQHPDDQAVDRFAAAMKDKLSKAREKGRSGWETCPAEDLSQMLREHVEKGDPRDVANFAKMLWNLGAGIAATPQPEQQRKPMTKEQMYELSNKANDDCMRDSDSQAPWSARPWTYHFARAIEAAHNIKEQP